MISAIKDLIATSPVPVAFDHFGGAKAELGPQQPGFAESGRERPTSRSQGSISRPNSRPTMSTSCPSPRRLLPRIQTASSGAPIGRIRVGSPPPGGKPTDVTPLLQIDDGRLLNQLAVWAPDPAIRRKILVDNPARLYAF
jgi:hypothetical protein